MFAHVHQALLGLFNVQLPENSVVQLISFADTLTAPALDASLDLKTRPDPLIQASARRTTAYLKERRNALGAPHGTPVRACRTLLAVKPRAPLPVELRPQTHSKKPEERR